MPKQQQRTPQKHVAKRAENLHDRSFPYSYPFILYLYEDAAISGRYGPPSVNLRTVNLKKSLNIFST